MAPDVTDFDRNVFINCPFDDDYRPILEATLFCLLDCGLRPRIASEQRDGGELRLQKIVSLIRESRYAIHDLSRVQATAEGEYARLNMPFELGVDHGFAQAGPGELAHKRLLVIAEDPFTYRVALSDIAGWDIRAHGGDFRRAIREVRSWLASNDVTRKPASHIEWDYYWFQEWDYERLLAQGWSETDIRDRPTRELLEAMRDWIRAGRPVTY